MAKLWTPAEVAARLGIDPSRVRRMAAQYNLGTKLGDRMRVYTEEDVIIMQQHSTGVPGRPRRLTESLELAASGWDEMAAEAIKDGDPESAERSMRLAGHMRRIAGNHRVSGYDPIQVVAPSGED
jgi:hypothetical protein